MQDEEEFDVSLHKIMALVEVHDIVLELVLHFTQIHRLMRGGCAPTSPGGYSAKGTG
jgi:hypothetical protein